MLPSSGTLECFCPACSRRNRPRSHPAFGPGLCSCKALCTSKTLRRPSEEAQARPRAAARKMARSVYAGHTERHKIACSAPFLSGW